MDLNEGVEIRYQLIDNTHPRFNRYMVMHNGEPIYQECFAKGDNPNLVNAWRRMDVETKATHIRDYIRRGFSMEDIKNLLYITYNEIDWLRKGAYKTMIFKDFINSKKGVSKNEE